MNKVSRGFGDREMKMSSGGKMTKWKGVAVGCAPVISISAVLLLPASGFAQQVVADGTTVTSTSDIVVSTGSAVEARNGGIVNLTAGSVTNTGTGSINSGLNAEGAGSEINSVVVVRTTGNDARGVVAENGGLVNQAADIITAGSGAYGAVAETASMIILSSGVVTTTGQKAIGLLSNGGNDSGGVINSSADISTSGDGAYGALAETNAIISLNGGMLTTIGADAFGVTANGINAMINSSATITTSGTTAVGAFAAAGGRINLTSGSVTTSGNSAFGLLAQNAGSVVDSSAAVFTSGDGAHGARASSGGIVIQSSNITTGGVGAYGAWAAAASAINLNEGTVTTTGRDAGGAMVNGVGASITARDTTILTSGSSAPGVNVEYGAAQLTDINILTTGDNASYGAAVNYTGATLLINGGTITTDGDFSFALLARGGSTLTANNVATKTTGDYAYGLSVLEGATVALTDSSITTMGQSSGGLVATHEPGTEGSSVTVDNVAVTTSGATAHGAVLQGGSSLSVKNGSSILAEGANSAALYVLTGSETDPSTVTVSGSSLNSKQYVGVLVDNATLNLDLTDSTLSASTAILADNNGILNLTADSSGIIGAASKNDTAVSNVSLHNNSTWDVTGNSAVTSLINDASTIRFGAPTGDATLPASYKTLTVADNYTGAGGTVIFNTSLGDDSSPSDRLVINGNTSGTTTVKVNNTGGVGAATSEGIEIITVDGASDGVFSLASDYVTADGKQAVIGGAYAYTLEKNGISTPTDGDWYLRSQLTPVAPQPEPEPGPRYQAGAPVYEAYPQALLGLNGLPSLQQRVGNRFWAGAGNRMIAEGADAIGTPYAAPEEAGVAIESSGVWGRIEGAHNHIEPDHSTTGVGYRQDIFKLQAGIDGLLTETEYGKLIGGITVHYARGSTKTNSIYDALNGGGSIDTDGYGFGGTLTWYGENGFYFDAQGQTSWYNSDLSYSGGNRALTEDNDGFGYALSIEGGRRIVLDPAWSITPQAQLVYSSVDFDDFRDAYGTRVALDQGNSLQGRLGMTIDHESSWQDANGMRSRTLIYGIANLYYEFLEGTRMNVDNVRFAQREDRLWGGIGAGGAYNWNDDKYSIYGEGIVNTSVNSFADSYSLKGNIGFRVKW